MSDLGRAGERTPDPPQVAQVPGHPSMASRVLLKSASIYPAAWRRLYGAEFEALLAELRPTPRVLFDVLVSAADAHLNPTGPPGKWPSTAERLRTSELAVFVGWVVFVVGGIGFQKLTEDLPALADFVRICFGVVIAGAVVALAAVLAAGVPIAWAICRSAIRAHRWRQLALLSVPVLAGGAWLALTFLLLQVPLDGVSDLLRVVVFLVWAGGFLLAVLASTVAVSVAAIRGGVDGGLYRRAAGPAALVAVAMVVVVAAVVAWGVGLLLTSPSVFWSDAGVMRTSLAVSWLAIVVVMATGAIMAARSAAAARRLARG